MDPVDHYSVLGLPSGEEGAKLTDKEISKAYKLRALSLHPDKRPDDPNAHDNFQKLRTSYNVLLDHAARKAFDDYLRSCREKLHRDRQFDTKRRRMVSDLERRERDSFSDAPDPERKARDEEERVKRKLDEEVARVRAMNSNKKRKPVPPPQPPQPKGTDIEVDKSKVLKVTWERVGGDYSAARLREVFQEFGEVEDVVIKGSKKKGSAVVAMASLHAAVAATQTLCGDLSNPLLVLPYQPVTPAPSVRAHEPLKPEGPPISNLVGAGYQAYENSVLEKIRRKAAQKQN